MLRLGLKEEIERIDDVHFRDKIDGDGKEIRLLGHHDAGQPVRLRVLLPVEKMFGWIDGQRIRQNARPAMRRRPQAHGLRPEGDQTVVAVLSLVVEGDTDAHGAYNAAHAKGPPCLFAYAQRCRGTSGIYIIHCKY